MDQVRSLNPSAWTLLLLAILSPSGCSKSESPESDGTLQPAGSVVAESKEQWESIYFDGAKVGHSNLKIEPIEDEGRSLLKISSELSVSVERFGQTVSQVTNIVSVETPAGQLVRFETRQSSGGAGPQGGSVTTGQVKDGRLQMKTTTLGRTESTAIPWDPENGGPFADRLSLIKAPMKPGERRTIRALFPIIHQPTDIQLHAIDYEETELLSGKRNLLRIESQAQFGPQTIKTNVWTDDKGETFKSATSTGGFQQLTYRTSKEAALNEGTPGGFDLGQVSLVRVDPILPDAHGTSRIVYRVRLEGGNPKEVFAECSSQRVSNLTEDGTAEITVWASRPGQDFAGRPSDSAPGPEDLGENNLIQARHPMIVTMAAEFESEDPWSLACDLERFVHQTVTTTAFSEALASAADVAKSKQGDCTEHAVLLAALCRARKIPCRVTIGLVYSRQLGGFAYHMWNEVWIDEHWIPLDATLGRAGIGAGHLKVSSTNLAGATPLSELLPVLEVLGKLELSVQQVD